MENKMIKISFDSLIKSLNIRKEELMSGRMEDVITKQLIYILTKAYQFITDNKKEPSDKINLEVTLRKPTFDDSVKVVTDPDTGQRFGRVPFECTKDFQIMEVTEVLKNLGDGTYVVSIVPKKKEVSETGS